MKVRHFLATAAVVCALFTSHAVYAASPANFRAPFNAMFAKGKTVKLSLRNCSSSSVEVRVGEDLMTIAAGQTVSLNLPVGARIVANTNTSTVQAGTLITEVSKELTAVLSLK